jgi:hypothetical protein
MDTGCEKGKKRNDRGSSELFSRQPPDCCGYRRH